MPDLEKPVTLGYLLRQGVSHLDCLCNACGRNRIVPLTLLLKTLPQSTSVRRAGRNLLCTRCRRKDVTLRLPRSGQEVRPFR